MPLRRTLARAAIPALAILIGIGSGSGCFASHGLGDVRLDAGAEVRDAAAARDAGAQPDAPPALDGGMCTAGDRAVAVRIEPITADEGRCRVTHVEGIAITAVEPAPADDGIRLRADFCPDADADCRCDVVIANVGTDVAPSVLPSGLLTLDVRAGSDPFGGAFVSIQQSPRCRCDGCACSLSLVLYAADVDPDMAPSLPPELAFARGSEVCPDMGCTSGTWNVAVRYPGGTLEVPQGSERADGAIHVRSVRDVDVFAPCAACAFCGTAHGSWIAWSED